MSLGLRDYQKEAVACVLDEFSSGITRQLISLPTGAGKTIVMAALAKEFNKRTLIIAHREELIEQAYGKIKLYWPEVEVGICMADRDELGAQIVVGSVQSCSRPKRLERLREQGFELLMIDEAHHASALSYQNIIEALGFGEDKSKLLLGVSATPHRSDKYGLGGVFEKLTYYRSIGTMIKAGYLSPVSGRKILTSFTLGKIKTQDSDFSIGALSEEINTPERNAFIAEKYKEYAVDRKGVVFCADVKHCHDLAEALNSCSIASKAVYGDMSGDERKKALESLKKGEIQVVTSCGVLTEGFDEPSICCVVMARPTRSQALYIQCVGRGLRLYPGKQNCLVLDFTDQGHNLDTVITLSNAIPEAIVEKEEKNQEAFDSLEKIPTIEISRECDQDFDILGGARFMWVDVGSGEWSLLDDNRNEIVMQPKDNGYIATLHFADGSYRKVVEKPIPLDYCQGCCEDLARKFLRLNLADTKASWLNKGEEATEKQRNFLIKKGVYKDGMSKAQASVEIRKLIGQKNKKYRSLGSEPLTNNQRYFLKSHGIDTEGMSKLDAIRAISELKQLSNK
jgi:ATP-dependent helicase IRC3